METDSFFDPLRERVIRNAPEEVVRQAVLQKMIGEFRFPKAYLAVERALSDFAKNPEGIPNRRLDIVAYTKSEGKLTPLLIVECKAVILQEKMLDQIFGYNHFVQAPFVALVNQKQTIFGQYDTHSNSYTLTRGFCSYDSLLKKITRSS